MMRILEGEEKILAEKWLNSCLLMSQDENFKNSVCKRHRCVAVIRKAADLTYLDTDTYYNIAGMGYNSPPRNLESQRRCLEDKSKLHPKVTDKTCCVHAEQRAIIDTLSRNAAALEGARMFFARMDEKGKMLMSGEPYCTICSKMALDVGIKEWVLWHPDGIKEYDAEEYNQLSYQLSYQFKG